MKFLHRLMATLSLNANYIIFEIKIYLEDLRLQLSLATILQENNCNYSYYKL